VGGGGWLVEAAAGGAAAVAGRRRVGKPGPGPLWAPLPLHRANPRRCPPHPLGPPSPPPASLYSTEGKLGVHGLALKRLACAGATDAVVQQLLPHIRVLEGMQACACGRAFVHSPAHLVEACDVCILRAAPGALADTAPCLVCLRDAHRAFGWKCGACSCVLHQSCLFKLWEGHGGYTDARCPQCRRGLERPPEAPNLSTDRIT
jgi:hypothetical protein